MDLLLKESDFRGEIDVPGTERSAVCEELARFITQYEPQFFDDALGIDLASDFYAAAAMDTIPAKWQLFIDGGTWSDTHSLINNLPVTRRIKGIRYCAARFVYWHYLRNDATLTAITGEVSQSAENASSVSGIQKQVTAWNNMSRELHELWLFLQYYKAGDDLQFPTFLRRLTSEWKFRRQNTMGF